MNKNVVAITNISSNEAKKKLKFMSTLIKKCLIFPNSV